MTAPRSFDRLQVLRHRARVQQVDRADAGPDWVRTTAVLDLGVQDTGPDGAGWALALRGVPVTAEQVSSGSGLAGTVMVWSLRGGPHLYRRDEHEAVARALVPWSEADARKRVFDASRPLVAAGTDVRTALAEIGRRMRELVTGPTRKGELSGALTGLLPEPYLRWCRPCRATHLYEQPFRLGALHAGLELEPATSPPVLTAAPGWPDAHLEGLADAVATDPARRVVPAHLDVVRAALHLLGPARPADLATFVDAPVRDVRARLRALADADETTEVEVDGEPRIALSADLEALARDEPVDAVRLLGPYDLLLQARDRELLVRDAARRTELWPVLGRPGAVLRDGEVVGTWRPRASGRRLAAVVEPWEPWDERTERAVDDELERLAAYRGLTPAGRVDR